MGRRSNSPRYTPVGPWASLIEALANERFRERRGSRPPVPSNVVGAVAAVAAETELEADTDALAWIEQKSGA